jgi:hypothetical protein
MEAKRKKRKGYAQERYAEVVTRLETGIISMFDELNARLDILDNRVGFGRLDALSASTISR